MKNLKIVSYTANFDTRAEANAFVAEATESISSYGLTLSHMSITTRGKFPQYDPKDPDKSNTPVGKYYTVNVSGSAEKEDLEELY